MQRLAALEAALAAALQARAELEQGMRRAFMRGVCALNLEVRLVGWRAGEGSTAAAKCSCWSCARRACSFSNEPELVPLCRQWR